MEEHPSSVGNYAVLDILGSGAFATVYSAQHTITGAQVALKAVAKRKLRSPAEFELLQREVTLMKNLDHPFIVSFFEVTDDPKNFYISMENVENGNLLDYINANRGLNEQQARRIFCQLVSVLEYLHFEKRVVHRDLKAENVLLDRHYNVRLVDFGLSKSFAKDDPFLQTTCGSPAYVAPEIIKESPYTAAADIWSLGILLYAMVVGVLPFNGDNIGSMLQMILRVNPSLPANLSPELKHLISRLLVKEPSARITIKELKQHPWIADFEDSRILSDEFGLLQTMRVVNLQELDTSVISEMRILGYDTAGLINELKSCTVNARTAAYKMLKRKLTIEEIHQWQSVKARPAVPEKPKEKLPMLEGSQLQKRSPSSTKISEIGTANSKLRVTTLRKPQATLPGKAPMRRGSQARPVIML